MGIASELVTHFGNAELYAEQRVRGTLQVWNDGATLTNPIRVGDQEHSNSIHLSSIIILELTSNLPSGSNPQEDSISIGSELHNPQLRDFQCPMQFNLSNGRRPRARTWMTTMLDHMS